MRKLFYIFVAFTAFAFGTLGYYFSPKIISTSLYDVTQNVEIYRRQKIHIKGYLEVHRFNLKNSEDNSVRSEVFSSLFDYKKFCSQDCITGATLELPENIENSAEFLNLTNELAEKNGEYNSKKGLYFVEVEITGEIEKTRGCFTLDYSIKTESIKQISPIQYMSESEFNKIIGRK